MGQTVDDSIRWEFIEGEEEYWLVYVKFDAVLGGYGDIHISELPATDYVLSECNHAAYSERGGYTKSVPANA